jgi:predicted nucleic acid-binding protein
VQPKVVIETLAKLYIQELVLNRKIDLVWSYVIKYENSHNIIEAKRTAIAQWENLSVEFVNKSMPLVLLADEIEQKGLKTFDALHLACAITANCDYFITVDRQVGKYQDDRIVICNPVDFINREVEYD